MQALLRAATKLSGLLPCDAKIYFSVYVHTFIAYLVLNQAYPRVQEVQVFAQRGVEFDSGLTVVGI